MDAATITAISAGVAAGVVVLAFLYNVMHRKSDSTQTTTFVKQGDIDQSNVAVSSSGGPTIAGDHVDPEGGIAGRDVNTTTNTIIYQSADPPATSSLHQLPRPPADFTGRADELAKLEEQVQQGGASISGVRGMGGVGKTALALELARRLTPKFPDAQIYLDLKGTTQPLTPADAMAHVIRSYNREAPLPESEEELTPIYNSVLHNQNALLLMDNALDGNQVRSLIPPQNCVILVTSRQHFDLRASFRWTWTHSTRMMPETF